MKNIWIKKNKGIPLFERMMLSHDSGEWEFQHTKPNEYKYWLQHCIKAIEVWVLIQAIFAFN